MQRTATDQLVYHAHVSAVISVYLHHTLTRLHFSFAFHLFKHVPHESKCDLHRQLMHEEAHAGTLCKSKGGL